MHAGNRQTWVFIMPKLEKGEFTIFPHKIAQFLSPLNQAVLFWLWKYANNETGKCFPSISTIALDCCTSRNSVIKAIKELEKCGRIKKQTRKGKHPRHNKTNLYTVLVPQNLHYPSAKSELGSAKSAQRTKLTELKERELNQDYTSSGDDGHTIDLLFSSTSMKQLAERLTRANHTASWRQALTSAFGAFKTVEEIWQRSRQLLALRHAQMAEYDIFDQRDLVELTKTNLNRLDERLRHGDSLEAVVEDVLEAGWDEANYYYQNAKQF